MAIGKLTPSPVLGSETKPTNQKEETLVESIITRVLNIYQTVTSCNSVRNDKSDQDILDKFTSPVGTNYPPLSKK